MIGIALGSTPQTRGLAINARGKSVGDSLLMDDSISLEDHLTWGDILTTWADELQPWGDV
jgi:hypothetical protein